MLFNFIFILSKSFKNNLVPGSISNILKNSSIYSLSKLSDNDATFVSLTSYLTFDLIITSPLIKSFTVFKR
jgi:hypothetical protein